ncbi:hypothetical protein SLNSH_08315 [Alsobacter soli]|uniref:DUF1476 domain-containing protein n=1 Tax=Alsobacter soli TaxID=2109933 RepID=A0A2T1HV83_9HYPH|nr:ATPase inhibitor subunit zeta [Alsobacter soli]PSC05575.1 hypothetical protein SLNSH_08315 [Alsobacter soli]
MTGSEDIGTTVLRNMLLGRWAADKLSITGSDADNYAQDLAQGTYDPARNDVFSKIRKDFDAAGVSISDTQILSAMTELMIRAGNQLSRSTGGVADAAAVKLKRNLMG